MLELAAPITSQTTSGETRSKKGCWFELARWEASSSISALVGAIEKNVTFGKICSVCLGTLDQRRSLVTRLMTI